MTVLRVCEVLVDKRYVACAEATFLMLLFFTLFDTKYLRVENAGFIDSRRVRVCYGDLLMFQKFNQFIIKVGNHDMNIHS